MHLPIDFSSLLSCLTRERLVEVGRSLGVSLPSTAKKDSQVEAFFEVAPAQLAAASLFQAPFRAGIQLLNHQLVPIGRALELQSANFFIADEVGPGKTIEAGLVLQHLGERARKSLLILDEAHVATSTRRAAAGWRKPSIHWRRRRSVSWARPKPSKSSWPKSSFQVDRSALSRQMESYAWRISVKKIDRITTIYGSAI